MEHVQQVTNVTIELWELIVGIGAVLVLLGAMLIGAGKALLHQIDKRFEVRDEATQKDMQELKDKTNQIERDMMNLSTALPREYVLREDWIRFSSTIDAKLDRLSASQDGMRTIVIQVAERVKSIVGVDNNER